MNNNLEFENTDPSPDSIEDNHPRTNYSEGWVQEIMYSEEDMTEYAIYIVFNNLITPKQWFEQFKKK